MPFQSNSQHQGRENPKCQSQIHLLDASLFNRSWSRAKFGVCAHKEHWKHEHAHPCINVKLYFVVKENIQQQEEVECERLRQHLIFWKKTLVMNVFG